MSCVAMQACSASPARTTPNAFGAGGHTSGVRLFGSDETNAGRRQQRRRMRAHGNGDARRLSEIGLADRIKDRSGNEPDQQLRAGIAGLDKRRSDWSAAFFRESATGLVRAAMRFATVRTRRIRENARSCRQLKRPRHHREQNRQENGCSLPHCLRNSTTKTPRRRPRQ